MARWIFRITYIAVFSALFVWYFFDEELQPITLAIPRVEVEKVVLSPVVIKRSITSDSDVANNYEIEETGLSSNQNALSAKLLRLVESDQLCEAIRFLNDEVPSNSKTSTVLDVLGQLPSQRKESRLSSEAESELLSAQSPLVGRFDRRYRSSEARFLSVIQNLVDHFEDKITTRRDVDLNESIKKMNDLIADDAGNALPNLSKAFLLHSQRAPEDKIKTELLKGLRKNKVRFLGSETRRAILDRAFQSGTAYYMALIGVQRVEELEYISYYHLFNWLMSQLHKDEDISVQALGLGYSMVQENWFRDRPFEEWRRASLLFQLGRDMIVKSHRRLYPEYPPPDIRTKYPKFDWAAAGVKNYKLNRKGLSFDKSCDRSHYDKSFELVSKIYQKKMNF